MPIPTRPLRLLPILLALAVPASAGEKSPPRIRPEGIDGALVIAGGGKLPDAVYQQFLRLAGGEEAHLVLIPTASARADRAREEDLVAPWKEYKPASVAVLHTRSRKQADDPAFVAPLKKATGVWIGGGSQARLAEVYAGTAVEKELHALLKRGGVVGGTSAGAAVLSRLMIASGNPEAKTGKGLGLLSGAVIDRDFVKRDHQKRLLDVLAKHPGHFGVGVAEGTALVVRGRFMRVVGGSTVTLALPAGAGREVRTRVLEPGRVADLTTWRRAARLRAGEPFPPAKAAVPEVPKGALVIVGGGGMPAAVTRKFIELAGGPEALIVVLPTAVPDPIPPDAGARFLRRAGAKNVHVLRARKLEDVESKESLDLLGKAGGIWFGGGRQWRFVDAYANTKAHEALRGVLRRGGVIGGSSAGASIQAEYLCRGNPLGNRDIACEGYEQGLGFLPGVGIDQHFARRKRFKDMTALMKLYPQILGIGIDEATALVVRGHVGEVMGRGKVYFYDRNKPVEEGKPDHEAVGAGQRYDLKARKVLEGKR